ncbi:MAG: hypothetical protein Q7R99_04410 [bacterium]|nr:hypothetical protein [bacterium]
MFLAEIFKRQSRGSVLILAILVLGLMVFLATYFISFSLTGVQMASSQKYASQAYYLAESGVQEAIFKLKNDSSWKSAFESCLPWVIPPYQRTGGIFSNGTYQITINKLGCGQAEIISQAFIDISANKKAQRIVKVKVFKAIGSGSGVENIAMFSAEGAGLSLRNSANVNIIGGSIFTGGVIDAQNSAKLSSDKSISARSQIDVENSASIIANASTTINAADCNGNIFPWPCNETPPESITMPAIDFDSSSLNSYKNQADFVYTEQEFKDLLDGDDNLTGIIYITGNVEITGSDKLTVNGLLAVDGNITLKNSSQLTINNAGDGKPAGLLAKGKIETENSSTLVAGGLVYALNEIRLGNSGSINLNGGIMSGTAIIFENSVSVNITYNQQAINIVLSSAPGDSPTISLEHWEEEY